MPDAWPAVFSLALGAFASVTAEFLPVGLLPRIAASFGITEGTAGLMMTVPGILAALAGPGIMLSAGRRDRRTIILALSVILLVACILSAVATDYRVMLLGRALVGLALGAFWSMGLAVAVRLVRPEDSSKAAATVFAGVTAAMILGVPLGTFVAGLLGWRGAFAVSAGIAAVALLAQIFLLPKVPASGGLRFSALLDLVAHAPFRRAMAMIALVFAAHFGAYTYVAPVLERAGVNAAEITLILIGYGATGFVSNFVASHFLGRTVKGSLLAAKLLLFVPLAAMPFLMAQPRAEIALVLVWGMAWGALPLALNTWTREASKGAGEAMAGMFTFTTQVAIAVGSGVGGLIVDHQGVEATFWVAAAAVLASCALLWSSSAQGSPQAACADACH